MQPWVTANLRLRAERDAMDEAKRREITGPAPEACAQAEVGDCACAPDAVCSRNAACPRVATRTAS